MSGSSFSTSAQSVSRSERLDQCPYLQQKLPMLSASALSIPHSSLSHISDLASQIYFHLTVSMQYVYIKYAMISTGAE